MASTIQWNDIKRRYTNNVMKNIEQNALFVFPTHASEYKHNMHQLETINSEFSVAKIPSIDHDPHALSATDDKVHGLMRVLFLCKGEKACSPAILMFPMVCSMAP